MFSGITLAPGRSWTRWIEKQCLTTMSMSSSPWTWRPWQKGWRPTTMWTKGSSLQTWKGCSQTAGQLCNLYWIEFADPLECFVDELNLQGLQRSRDWILQQRQHLGEVFQQQVQRSWANTWEPWQLSEKKWKWSEGAEDFHQTLPSCHFYYYSHP